MSLSTWVTTGPHWVVASTTHPLSTLDSTLPTDDDDSEPAFSPSIRRGRDRPPADAVPPVASRLPAASPVAAAGVRASGPLMSPITSRTSHRSRRKQASPVKTPPGKQSASDVHWCNTFVLRAMNGDIAWIRRALRRGIPVNTPHSCTALTPLQAAADVGREDVVRYLLKQPGCAVDARQHGTGQTALHFAATNSNTTVTEALLAAGANFRLKNAAGQTPLVVAVECENGPIVKMLGDPPEVCDSLLGASRGPYAVHLRWDKPVTHGLKIIKFEVHCVGLEKPTKVRLSSQRMTLQPQTRGHRFLDLVAGRVYLCGIRTRTLGGWSPMATVEVTTPGCVPDPPSNPHVATADGNDVVVRWEAPATEHGGPVLEYCVQISPGGFEGGDAPQPVYDPEGTSVDLGTGPPKGKHRPESAAPKIVPRTRRRVMRRPGGPVTRTWEDARAAEWVYNTGAFSSRAGRANVQVIQAAVAADRLAMQTGGAVPTVAPLPSPVRGTRPSSAPAKRRSRSQRRALPTRPVLAGGIGGVTPTQVRRDAISVFVAPLRTSAEGAVHKQTPGGATLVDMSVGGVNTLVSPSAEAAGALRTPSEVAAGAVGWVVADGRPDTLLTVVKDVPTGTALHLRVLSRNQYGWSSPSPATLFQLATPPLMVSADQTAITLKVGAPDMDTLEVQYCVALVDLENGCLALEPAFHPVKYSDWQDTEVTEATVSKTLAGTILTVDRLLPGTRYKFRQRTSRALPWSAATISKPILTAADVPTACSRLFCAARSPSTAMVTWSGPRPNGAPVTGFTLSWSRVRQLVDDGDSESGSEGEAAESSESDEVVLAARCRLTPSITDVQDFMVKERAPHAVPVLPALRANPRFIRMGTAWKRDVDVLPPPHVFGQRLQPLRFMVSGLKPGKYYKFSVSARNECGEGAPISGPDVVRSHATVPGRGFPPVALAVSPTEVEVYWSFPKANGLVTNDWRLEMRSSSLGEADTLKPTYIYWPGTPPPAIGEWGPVPRHKAVVIASYPPDGEFPSHVPPQVAVHLERNRHYGWLRLKRMEAGSWWRFRVAGANADGWGKWSLPGPPMMLPHHPDDYDPTNEIFQFSSEEEDDVKPVAG